MVKRIHNEEKNIFLATGPTLFTDVIFNSISNQEFYNTKLHVPSYERYNLFMNNANYMNGTIIYESSLNNFYNQFQFRMQNYDENMLYNNNNTKYVVTFNEPTPNFYK